jgi:hypothetical protein
MGNKRGLACALHNLAYLALHRSDVAGASAAFGESLRLFDELQFWGVTWSVAGLAGVAVVQGRAERAARLFATAESHLASYQGGWFRAHQIEIERNRARARALLSDEAWDAAYAEGLAMTLEQAIAYGLAGTS